MNGSTLYDVLRLKQNGLRVDQTPREKQLHSACRCQRAAVTIWIAGLVLSRGAITGEIPRPLPGHPGNMYGMGEEVRVPLSGLTGNVWRLANYEGAIVAQGKSDDSVVLLGTLPVGYYEVLSMNTNLGSASDPQRLPFQSLAEGSIPLAEAIKAFNAKAAVNVIGKEQSPLTEDEVVAAIRARELPKDTELSDMIYRPLQQIRGLKRPRPLQAFRVWLWGMSERAVKVAV